MFRALVFVVLVFAPSIVIAAEQKREKTNKTEKLKTQKNLVRNLDAGISAS